MLYIVLLYHTIFYYSVFYYNSLNTAIIYSITIHLQLFTYIPLYLYIYIIRDLLSPLLDDSSSKKNWCYRPPHGHHGRVAGRRRIHRANPHVSQAPDLLERFLFG
jgi:hypothetical protein